MLRGTYLQRLRVVHPAQPPLLLKRKVALKVNEKVGGWHGSTREEISRHPSVVEVVWCTPVTEEMNKELSTRLQQASDLSHEQFVVLHVFEEL